MEGLLGIQLGNPPESIMISEITSTVTKTTG